MYNNGSNDPFVSNTITLPHSYTTTTYMGILTNSNVKVPNGIMPINEMYDKTTSGFKIHSIWFTGNGYGQADAWKHLGGWFIVGY